MGVAGISPNKERGESDEAEGNQNTNGKDLMCIVCRRRIALSCIDEGFYIIHSFIVVVFLQRRRRDVVDPSISIYIIRE